MKTLSAFNQTAVDGVHVGYTRLFEFSLGGVLFYFCSKKFGASTPFVFDSKLYDPLVIDYDEVSLGEIRYDGSIPDPTTTSFLVDNTVPIAGFTRFSTVFKDLPFFYQAVMVYDIFDGASLAADKILIFSGFIEDIEIVSSDEIRIHCTGPDTSLLNKVDADICDPVIYTGADPDDIGKLLPIVYGSASHVPFLSVDAGAITTLAAELTATATSIVLSDSARINSAGGIIQIDLEEITYHAVVGTTLTGCTRGYNGTEAVIHNIGAIVAELQTNYDFIIGHAVRSIDKVYVENTGTGLHVQQNPSVYTEGFCCTCRPVPVFSTYTLSIDLTA